MSTALQVDGVDPPPQDTMQQVVVQVSPFAMHASTVRLQASMDHGNTGIITVWKIRSKAKARIAAS